MNAPVKAYELPSFSYTIRRSVRSTRLRILVSENKVEAVAPVKFDEQAIHQFVFAKQIWIIQSLAKMTSKNAERIPLAPSRYCHGAAIPYLGKHYQLSVLTGTRKRIKISFSDGFTVCLPSALPIEESGGAIKSVLQAWMKKQALLLVKALVAKHACQHQLMPRSINIRAQKSRWGSCGIYNDIQVNWRLVLAPVEVLEYVVVHELCHIREKNHSQRFWDLVAWHLPDYQGPKRWLKQYGGQLMAGF